MEGMGQRRESTACWPLPRVSARLRRRGVMAATIQLLTNAEYDELSRTRQTESDTSASGLCVGPIFNCMRYDVSTRSAGPRRGLPTAAIDRRTGMWQGEWIPRLTRGRHSNA